MNRGGDDRSGDDPAQDAGRSPPARPPVPAPPKPPRPSATAIPVPKPPAPRPVPRPPTARPAPVTAPTPTPNRGGAAAPRGANIDLAPGDVFAGRYRIDKQVGRGGMGAVYLAEQEPLARKVAIKVLHGTADDTTVARFQREARLIAQLQHPHIVNLIDFGEDDGRLFLVMEFIDGESLTSLLKHEAPMPPTRVCEIGRQIAEALAVAHDIQVVHRDVKPDNVMIIKTAAGQDFVKMLDFGVAKIKREGDAQNTIETKAGLIVGSLRYISPEQVESSDITTGADVYSLGCILYEMLTGRRVFDYPSPADCAIAHLTEKPKAPTIDGRPLSGPLVDLTMRCLEKKPGKRPAHAREVLQVLMACRENPARLAAPPDDDKTIHMANGMADLAAREQPSSAGAANLQNAMTIELSALAMPAARPEPEPRALPDASIRRSTGTHELHSLGRLSPPCEFTVGGATSTHERGALVVPKKRRWWLWVVLGVVVSGGAAAALVLTRGDTPAKVTPTHEAKPPTTVDTEQVPQTTGTDVSATAPEADTTTPDKPDTPTIAGTHIVTTPPGAEVLLDKKMVCQTPCTLPWLADEKPPRVRLKLTGHIDIDLQLVRGDHGTEQRFELRPAP